MEEAKDIRELKSLLSDLSLQDDAKKTLSYREDDAGNADARKIVLLKSVSVFLFSLSLFLILCLISLLVRGYLTDASYHEKRQTKAVPLELKEVPAITPAPVISDQSITSPAVPPEDLHGPAVVEKASTRTAVLKEEGGSLYFISLKNYGKADETLFDLILQANPAIVNVRTIDDHHHITLPEITAESYIRKTPDGRFRVHIGTFDTAEWAKVYVARVRNKEKHIFIEPQAFSSQDTWYRLTMGDFENREEALQTISSLAKRGLIYIPPQPG